MPRVRLTAGSWLLAAAMFGGRPGPAGAMPRRRSSVAGPAPGAAAAGARPAETEARRREEIDAVQRQDVADALKKHFNIDVDWRTTPLDKLIDIRVRAAKAADLQARLGVSVDWQRYSWIELEALRRTLLSFEQYRNAEAPAGAAPVRRNRPSRAVGAASASTNGLVRPTFKVRAAGRAGRSSDPDAIIRPTFTGRTEAPARDARSRRRHPADLRGPAALVVGGRGSGRADRADIPAGPAVRADRRRRRSDGPDAHTRRSIDACPVVRAGGTG